MLIIYFRDRFNTVNQNTLFNLLNIYAQYVILYIKQYMDVFSFLIKQFN